MKRVFSIIFFLFFITVQLSPLYAQAPTISYSTPPAAVVFGTPTPPPSMSITPVMPQVGITAPVTISDTLSTSPQPTPFPTLVAPTLAPFNGFENIPLLGVTCGVVGKKEVDAGKATRCCFSEKQDTGLMTSIGETASKMPVIGGLFDNFFQAAKTRNEISHVMPACDKEGIPSTTDAADKNCICIKDVNNITAANLNLFCENYFKFTPGKSESELQQCARCMAGSTGFYTAFGCIPLNLTTFINEYVLSTGIGIAGGIALLCILYSAFRMQTSMGNPEAIKKAQENLTACITGLIIIIFSVLILKIIGVDILRIPGMGN